MELIVTILLLYCIKALGFYVDYVFLLISYTYREDTGRHKHADTDRQAIRQTASYKAESSTAVQTADS